MDTAEIAKLINAIPALPIVNAIKGKETPKKEKGKFSPDKYLQEFAFNRLIEEVKNEYRQGSETIDKARQPWETMIGSGQVAFSPVAGLSRVGFGDPAREVTSRLGGSPLAADSAGIVAEILGMLVAPGVGIDLAKTKVGKKLQGKDIRKLVNSLINMSTQ